MSNRFPAFGLVLFALISAQLACGGGSAATQIAPLPPAATQPPAKGERGTPDEAQALLKVAIDHYNQVGAEQAHADFNAGTAPWVDRDLYVVCLRKDHTESVNAGFPQYVGVNPDTLFTTGAGVPLGQAILDAAAAGGAGYADYSWVNPVSNQTEPKRLFVQAVGDEVCGVGAYNP